MRLLRWRPARRRFYRRKYLSRRRRELSMIIQYCEADDILRFTVSGEEAHNFIFRAYTIALMKYGGSFIRPAFAIKALALNA